MSGQTIQLTFDLQFDWALPSLQHPSPDLIEGCTNKNKACTKLISSFSIFYLTGGGGGWRHTSEICARRGPRSLEVGGKNDSKIWHQFRNQISVWGHELARGHNWKELRYNWVQFNFNRQSPILAQNSHEKDGEGDRVPETNLLYLRGYEDTIEIRKSTILMHVDWAQNL